MLLPEPVAELDDSALDAAYAWPDTGRWVRANMVSSVDGAAHGPNGLSRSISSDADRMLFGRLRGTADVVLVGATTVRDEGYRAARARPEYAARRAAAGQRPAPVIAVVTRSLDLDPSAPLFAEPVERPVVLTVDSADPERVAALSAVADVVPCGDDDVDLPAALDALEHRGLRRIHSEGGPTVLAQLAAAGLLDELCLTLSPLLAGGGTEPGAVPRILHGSPLPRPPEGLELMHVLTAEGALFLRYRVAR